MHGGTLTEVARTEEPSTGRQVVRLVTDAPPPERAVFVPFVPGAALPQEGEPIRWDQHHVTWSGGTLHKVGYAFDPADHTRNE